jgi:hypothetical protein
MGTIREILKQAINTLDGLRSDRATNYEKWQEDGGEEFKRNVDRLDQEIIPVAETKVAELQKRLDEEDIK